MRFKILPLLGYSKSDEVADKQLNIKYINIKNPTRYLLIHNVSDMLIV